LVRWARIHPARALTGITAAEVDRIAATTDPEQRRGRPPGLTHRDRVLPTRVALRTNLTERALAAIFDISQPTAHRIIGDLAAGLLHEQVTSEMACPGGSAGRMLLCPDRIPESSVMMSCGSPVTVRTG
jgi:hypothetical protein